MIVTVWRFRQKKSCIHWSEKREAHDEKGKAALGVTITWWSLVSVTIGG